MPLSYFVQSIRIPLVVAIVSLASPAYAGLCNHLAPQVAGYNFAPHKVTYNKASSSPGDLITLGNRKFRVVRIPFVEFKTGKEYAVIFPVELISQGGGESFIASFSTSHIKSTACNDFEVPGKKNNGKKLGVYESRHFSFNSSAFAPGFESTTLSVIQSMGTSLSAQIGETLLVVYLSTGIFQPEINNTNVPAGDFDLEGNVDTKKLDHGIGSTLSELDKLIDYVYVEKL